MRNPSWHILGADLVNKAPNIKEELNTLAFKRKHVILSGGVMAFYEPRKKKIELEKSRRCHFKNEMLKKNSKRNINQNTEGETFFIFNIFCLIKESQSNLCDFLTATYLKK